MKAIVFEVQSPTGVIHAALAIELKDNVSRERIRILGSVGSTKEEPKILLAIQVRPGSASWVGHHDPEMWVDHGPPGEDFRAIHQRVVRNFHEMTDGDLIIRGENK